MINNYMFNFIDNNRFSLLSVRVGRGPSALICTGAYNAGKTDGPVCIAYE
jgi:hypothetical protein